MGVCVVGEAAIPPFRRLTGVRSFANGPSETAAGRPNIRIYMLQETETITTRDDLAGTGLSGVRNLHANLGKAALVEIALHRNEGKLSNDGALVVETGPHTGRSVQDKFIVEEDDTRAKIWWGRINQAMSSNNFARLTDNVRAYLYGQELFTQDLYAGADRAHRIRIRLVTTSAWHALFARNMFIRPEPDELVTFEPDYVILHAPDHPVDPATCGSRTSTVIALSFTKRLILISGTRYAGEIKKSIFTVMNWVLPAKGILPMHCSANEGADGEVALFFGLSGTGKTTLSSDPARHLIGDDEHGWSPDGIFNFEGGCYAKVLNLRRESELAIWDASHRFGSVLENVAIDRNGALDLDDGRLTENTRSCYPIDYIPNVRTDGRGRAPRNIVMLTADAFGVLPPIARLTATQAMYHFLSGYTARVAGTERGLGREPQATFSTCFGAPFLPRPPEVYGKLLQDYLAQGNVCCWLINTGWSGGAYGVGRRISIEHTRALVTAALSGKLSATEFRNEPYFGLSIPVAVAGVPEEVLDPSCAWPDRAAYEAQAATLAEQFMSNETSFSAGLDPVALQQGAIRSQLPRH